MAALLLTRPMPHEPFVRELRAAGFDAPVWTSLDEADPAAVRWLLAWRLGREIAPRLPALELVMSMGAGVEKVLAADLPLQVPVTRVVDPEQALGMAQYVVHAVLDHLRGAADYRRQQQERDWTRRPMSAARDPVLVLGLGAIGERIALALHDVGLAAIGWSRSARTLPGVECVAGDDGLEAALARARVLVNALPLTPSTRGLLDRRLLSRLPQGAYVVNVARGEHLIEDDLIALLEQGHLSGAALDVQAREPLPPEHPLWTAPNVTITPHVASQSSERVVMRQFADAIAAVRAGLPVPNRVDRDRGY